MESSRNKVIFSPSMTEQPCRKKEMDLVKRNYQLMRKKAIDALVEFARNEIVDKYYDLEN